MSFWSPLPMAKGARGRPAGGRAVFLIGLGGCEVGTVLPHWARICPARIFVCLVIPWASIWAQSKGWSWLPVWIDRVPEVALGAGGAGREASALLLRTMITSADTARASQTRLSPSVRQ